MLESKAYPEILFYIDARKFKDWVAKIVSPSKGGETTSLA